MTKQYNHPELLLDEVGTQLEPTQWMPMEQERVNQFAGATDDHQWIHIDSERAAQGPFGACIAHGFLTLSLANKFLPELIHVENVTMGVNYGCDNVRFPNAVKVGQRIRGRGEIIKVERKQTNAVQAVIKITIDIEGQERPACVVDTISRYYFENNNE